MEYNIVINQAALRKWIESGKVDATDAIIIAFIRGLHPDDPVVRQFMNGDYFRIHLGWLLQEVPILKITKDWLSRRLHALASAGIMQVRRIVDQKKQFKLYARLSPEYYKEERKARESTMGVQSHGSTDRGSTVPGPWEYTPIDHKKDDHKKGRTAPLLTGEAVSAQEEEEPTAEDITALIASLPWKKGAQAS
jgi:hypothetical protein